MGIVLYIVSMWVAGIMEGLMWRAYDQYGFLQYSFVESVIAVHPFYVIRMLGGVFFLTGALIMVYNLIRTVTARPPRHPAATQRPASAGRSPWRESKADVHTPRILREERDLPADRLRC